MADVVWQFDAQYVFDFGGMAEPYYWTNCWYWLQDESIPSPIPSIVNELRVITQNACATWARRHSYRIRSIPSIGYDVVTTLPVAGNGPGSGGVLMYSAVYMGLYDEDTWVGYKRLRGPWGTTQTLNSSWNPLLMSYLNTNVAVRVGNFPACNVRGVPYSLGVLNPYPNSWQKRHGTKRSARLVFV